MGEKKEAGGERRRGSPLIGWIIIVLSVAACFFSYVNWDERLQRSSVVYLEAALERLEPAPQALEVELLSVEGGSVKARLKLLDRAGREVAMIEKAWPGSILCVDAIELPLRGSKAAKGGELWLAFPGRIYTDALPPASGYSLLDAYDSSGFPAVLEGIEWSAEDRATLSKAYARAKRNSSSKLPELGTKVPTGALARTSVRLAGLGIGKAYGLVFRSDGSISIKAEAGK